MASFQIRFFQILSILLLAGASPAWAQEARVDGTYTVAGRDSFLTVHQADDAVGFHGALDDGVERWVRAVHPTQVGADGVATVDSSRWVTAPDAQGLSVEIRPSAGGLDALREQGGQVVGSIHLTKVKLALFPGETTTSDGTTLGHIYVLGGRGESYEIAAGPPPGQGGLGAGGHHAGVTPAGRYVLSPQEHHVTSSWPNSTIPWGATLATKDDGFVYYEASPGSPWVQVTGPKGVFTESMGAFWDRSAKAEQASMGPRDAFASDTSALHDQNGQLVSPWNLNDFGNWAWNLTKGGERSVYYVHTTPDDEALFAQGQPTVLANSHGCVHLHPPDRDEMMARGYLAAGVDVEVMPYGEKGPPAP